MSTPNTIGYIGIGSNLENPLQQVNQAIDSLKALEPLSLLRRSPWFNSKAVGPGVQDDYINGVIEFESPLPAESLLPLFQKIEADQGRERKIHWGPRTLDLDFLYYGNTILRTDFLTLPHPHISERNFVLAPLATLNPELILPRTREEGEEEGEKDRTKNATIAQLLASCGEEGLWLAEGEQGVVELRQ